MAQEVKAQVDFGKFFSLPPSSIFQNFSKRKFLIFIHRVPEREGTQLLIGRGRHSKLGTTGAGEFFSPTPRQ
jgi:hypothetical protein